MEELHAGAIAYYNHGDANTREEACAFFRSMDTDGDGRISYPEFCHFVQRSGYNGILQNDPDLFLKLDRNREGGLDLCEVLTFYYIINAGYITCQSCRAHLCGLYFTCVECFDAPGAANYYYPHHHPTISHQHTTYDLCATCYGNGNYSHDQHSYFLDSHVLLRSKRGTPHAGQNLSLQVAPQNPREITTINNYHYGNPAAPPVQRKRRYQVIKGLGTAVSCSAFASNCTIM